MGSSFYFFGWRGGVIFLNLTVIKFSGCRLWPNLNIASSNIDYNWTYKEGVLNIILNCCGVLFLCGLPLIRNGCAHRLTKWSVCTQRGRQVLGHQFVWILIGWYPDLKRNLPRKISLKTWKLKLKTLCIVFNWEIMCYAINRKIGILFLHQRLQTESLQDPDR